MCVRVCECRVCVCVCTCARACVCVCVDEYVCLLRVCGLVGVTPLLSGVGMLDALYFNRSVLDPKCLLHDGVYMELFEKIYIYMFGSRVCVIIRQS